MASTESDAFYNAEDVCKKIHPSKYLKEHLQKGIRPVGNRKHFSYRSVIGNINVVKSCCGSSIVKIGNTTVLCGISHEVTSPSRKYPRQGLVDINCKLSEHCNIQHNYKNKVVQLRQCTNLLQKLFLSLNIIDLNSLCIAEGEYVWLLRVHLICLDYDGAFWDGAVLAMYLALKSLKLPEISYDVESKSFQIKSKNLSPIPVGKFPLATTFGLFQKFVFADPNREEEELCGSFVTIITEKDDIKVVQKRGGTLMMEQQLNECLNVAKARYKVMESTVETILKQSVL
ncbi:exosome complex component RRP43-like [Cimex lectularius]|uniref:Ribosomal RNA-processing protein 43 n=1 Tax=Cimex lectularius TaxID=79782 RepID=A0A8I6S0L4_CIMLE|nr:exosome complex component RRP43-like [Cimex lectularius]